MATILALRASNYKILKAGFELAFPKSGVIEIVGNNGAGKCIPEGTLVALWNGTRKAIEDIRETDLLVGMNPETHCWIPENPLQMMTSGVQEVFEVRTRTGYCVHCTSGHRLMTPEGWSELRNFKINDYVAIPLVLPSGEPTEPISNSEAMLVGLLLGDGSFKNCISFTAADPGVREMFCKSVNSLWPELAINEVKIPGKTVESISSFRITKGTMKGRTKGPHNVWADKHGLSGKSSYTKFIPEYIFRSGIEGISNFLAGLFSTDGHVHEDGTSEYYTRSYKLAFGVRGLLIRSGISCAIRSRMVNKNKHEDPFKFYRVSIVTKSGRERFRSIIMPLMSKTRIYRPNVERKKTESSRMFSLPPYLVGKLSALGIKNLDSGIRGHNRISRDRFLRAVDTLKPEEKEQFEKFTSTDVGWDQIISIESIGQRQTFDLSMPSEAFIANDFLVHNSSALDVLWATLGGKSASADEPIRKGQRNARSEVVIIDVPNYGRIRVVREWWLGGTKLTITDENENNIRSPQTLLDSLISHITFDPVEFLRLGQKDPKQQFLTFCQIVGVDFSDLDVRRKAAYEERTQVGKAVKTIEARVADMPERPPTEDVDAVDLAEKLRKAYQANAGFETLKSQYTEQAKRVGEAISAVEKAKQVLVEATEKMTRAQFELENMQKKIDAYPLVPTEELQAKLDNATATNVQAKEYRERKAALEELQANRAHHEDLTLTLDQIDAERRKRLSEAKMPVEGIDLTLEGEILLNGVPLSQASTAEAIRASIMIGAARKPELRLMNIKDGSLLDDKSFGLIADWAKANDYQILEERMGSSQDDIKEYGVVIEEGEIVETKPGVPGVPGGKSGKAKKEPQAKPAEEDFIV